MKKMWLFYLFLVAMLAWPRVSLAQEVSLSVSPLEHEIVTRPGQSFTLPFTLSNLADPQLVTVKITSVQPQSDGTLQMKGELDGPVKLALDSKDIALNEPFFMKGNEKIRVNLRVDVPAVLQEKDYYFSLLMQSQAPPTSEGQITARTQLAVASNILISVTSDGTLETKPKVAAFYAEGGRRVKLFGRSYSIVQSGQKVPLVAVISNSGRHLIKARGEVTVRGLGPKKSLVIEPQRIPAYSQATVLAGKTSAKPDESAVLDGLFFGPYTISATVNFGPGSPVVYTNTAVIAVPNLPTSLVILAIVAGAAVYFLKFRNRD